MTKDQKEKLGTLFSRYDEIELVYLYGSHATGRARAGSDLDLAVSAWTDDYAGLKLDLLEQLALAGFEQTDVAYFQQSTPLLRFQMVRYNQLLYCRPDVSSGALFSRCLNEYFDLEPILRYQRAAYKQRMLHG
jgi:uncharacterized protein